MFESVQCEHVLHRHESGSVPESVSVNVNERLLFISENLLNSMKALLIPHSLFEQPTTSTTFLKDNLQPFTEYEFRLVASNTYGSTQTPWVVITTKQDSKCIVVI